MICNFAQTPRKNLKTKKSKLTKILTFRSTNLGGECRNWKKKNILHFQEVSPLCNYRLYTLPRATFGIISTALLERPNIPRYHEGTNISSSPGKCQEIFAHQANQEIGKAGFKIKRAFLSREDEDADDISWIGESHGKKYRNFVSWFQSSLNPCPTIALSCLGQS